MTGKGIIFSIDAILALLIVVILAGWMAQHSLNAVESASTFENVKRNALDEAIISSYSRIPGIISISPAAEQGKCATVYSLDPNNDLGERSVAAARQVCTER